VLDPDATVSLVAGVARRLSRERCALLGGELAEMPGFYQPGDYELVGFIVGMVDRPSILDGSRVRAGRLCCSACARRVFTPTATQLARRILFDRHRLALGDRVPGTELRVGPCAARAAPLVSARDRADPHPSRSPRAGAHHRRRHHRQPAARAVRQGTHARIEPRVVGGPALFRALGELG
jgi:phosphoribosylformylglycinamidine cyclo-ligase